MNILYIANHLNSGGITSYLLSLASGMKEKGHNVFIAAHSGEKLDKFLQLGVNFIRIPIKTKKEIGLGVFLSFLKLKDECKKHKIDIVHSNSRTTQVVGCLLERFGKVPHLSTCHGFFKRRVTRRILGSWGEKVIAVSQPVKEHLIRDFGVKEKNITLIYNGIEVARFKNHDAQFKAKMKRDLGLADAPVVGIVGRLSDVKGHSYLIEAMQEVLKKIPQARLVIVGEGKMKKRLVSLSRRLEIAKSILFIPSVKETRDILSIMDVFAMPSLKEGLGLALMEAMATGLAVIGSNVGGIKDLVQDGQTGLLVEPANVVSLASAISQLFMDSEKRTRLGHQAQIFISQNFTQEKMVAETEKVYEEYLKTPKP